MENPPIKIELRFFASLREALGVSSLALETDAATVSALRDQLLARGGVWADALARSRPLRVAVDQRLAPESCALREGAEVAFFPPVTGG